jgi:hypothetical protein
MVGITGADPVTDRRERSVLPLNYIPMDRLQGIEP